MQRAASLARIVSTARPSQRGRGSADTGVVSRLRRDTCRQRTSPAIRPISKGLGTNNFTYPEPLFHSGRRLSTRTMAAAAKAGVDCLPGKLPNWTWQQSMIRIKDPEASLKFYCDGLGLTLVDKLDMPQVGCVSEDSVNAAGKLCDDRPLLGRLIVIVSTV